MRDQTGVLQRMLRALGCLCFQPAAFFLPGQIAARDAHGAGQEDGHTDGDQQNAQRCGNALEYGIFKRTVDTRSCARTFCAPLVWLLLLSG